VTNRIPRYVTGKLEDNGYEVIRSPLSYSIAWVHGIRIVDGVADGGADPGADGMALAV
jgi:gamma-glutamyltranspeptidase / glutathione hydrolase